MATRLQTRFILPLICLVFSFVLAVAGSDVVHVACKKIEEHQDYCVEALSSATKIKKAAGTADVAAAALNLAMRNTSASAQYLENQHVEKDDHDLEDCLNVCKEDYLDAAEHLSDAEVAMEDENYDKVLEYIEAAIDFIKYCTDGCKSLPQPKNPVTKRNEDVKTLCTITMSLVKLVHS